MLSLTVDECWKHPLFEHLGQQLERTLWEQLRIMGDCLEEMGQVGMARAYRALAAAGRMPYLLRGYWCWRKTPLLGFLSSYMLPQEAMKRMKVRKDSPSPRWWAFPSLHEAYWAAAICCVDAGLYTPDLLAPTDPITFPPEAGSA